MGVADCLTTDHRRIDAHLAGVGQCIGDDWPRAEAHFLAFRTVLERHMAAEEGYLFPAYEAAFGAGDGLTTVLRKGHRDLRSFFDEIAQALRDRDTGESASLVAVVRQIVHHHDEKEEQVLYPRVAALPGVDAAQLSALIA